MGMDGVSGSVQSQAAIFAMKAAQDVQAQQVQTLVKSTEQPTQETAQAQSSSKFVDLYA